MTDSDRTETIHFIERIARTITSHDWDWCDARDARKKLDEVAQQHRDAAYVALPDLGA